MLLFLLYVPATLSHHHSNTIPKSVISFRCSQLKSEHYLKKGRENAPRSEIKLKLFNNQLGSSKNMTPANMMTRSGEKLHLHPIN